MTLGGEPRPATSSLQASGNNTAARPDLVHTVADGETLWDIAKKSTGDANNWHIIADINDLEQNAAVFPGQELTIPGELARNDSAPPAADVIAQLDRSEQQDSTAGPRLALPETAAVNTDAIAVELDDSDLAGVTPLDNAAFADAVPAAGQYAVAYELEDGETLWNLAKRATGDATNWEAIAAHNEFTEKQAVTVRPGQTIYVPEPLVEGTTAIAQSEAVESNEDVAVISAPSASDAAPEITITEPSQEEIDSARAAVSAAVELPGSASAEISSLPTAATEAATELQAAGATAVENTGATAIDVAAADETTYSTENALDPDAENLATGDIAENSNIPAVIMVSGTYFPKAVYNDADFSSSLLMRVSPGTTLQVSREMGPWYEVETEEGVGYVHQRDIQ